MTHYTLTYDDLKLDISSVNEFMGNVEPTDDVKAELDSIINEIRPWLKPQICFTVFTGGLDVDAKTLEVEGNVFNAGRIVTRQLRGSDAYAFFVCTAGMEFQDYQERLMAEGDMVRVFLADALGSCLAEACADRMEERLQASIDKLGWKRTNRFSPGYCGWHVREQQMLFSLMNGVPKKMGVNLTDSCLMIPIKSVSGVIGLGPDVRYLPYTCGLCDYVKCYKRRKKQ